MGSDFTALVASGPERTSCSWGDGRPGDVDRLAARAAALARVRAGARARTTNELGVRRALCSRWASCRTCAGCSRCTVHATTRLRKCALARVCAGGGPQLAWRRSVCASLLRRVCAANIGRAGFPHKQVIKRHHGECAPALSGVLPARACTRALLSRVRQCNGGFDNRAVFGVEVRAMRMLAASLFPRLHC